MAWYLVEHEDNFNLELGIALGYGLDDRGFKSRQGLGIFFLHCVKPPIQWVPGALSLGVKRQVMKLTTHIHLVPRSRMRGSIPALPKYTFMASCSVKAQ
jgi:hypothetical protein